MSKKQEIFEYEGKKYKKVVDKRIKHPCFSCTFYDYCLYESDKKVKKLELLTKCDNNYDHFFKEITE